MSLRLRLLLLLTLTASSFPSNAESPWDKPIPLLAKPTEIVVYRSPTCGCCGKWLEHLRHHHFNVVDHITDDMDGIKRQYGVPQNLASCHTAIVEGYVIEGHVPAADIQKLLAEKPPLKGLAVPGMVTGSPGMEMGERHDPFKVIGFEANGQYRIFNAYEQY